MQEVRFLPDDKRIVVRPGTSLLEAAQKAKVALRARCGGNAACLMCKVIVKEPEGITPMMKNEERKLGSLVCKGYRLACQARVTGKVTVEIPEDPLKAAIRKQLAEQQEDRE